MLTEQELKVIEAIQRAQRTHEFHSVWNLIDDHRTLTAQVAELQDAIWEIGHIFILVGSISDKALATVRQVMLSREELEE